MQIYLCLYIYKQYVKCRITNSVYFHPHNIFSTPCLIVTFALIGSNCGFNKTVGIPFQFAIKRFPYLGVYGFRFFKTAFLVYGSLR